MKRTRYQYRARTLLSHRDTGATTRPGELADLSHLAPDDVQRLLDLGAVAREPVTDAAPPEARNTEDTHGDPD